MIGKSTKKIVLNVIIVLFIAILRQILDKHFNNYYPIIGMLFAIVIFRWKNSIEERFVRDDLRGMLGAIAWLLIFFIFIQTIKYSFFSEQYVSGRLLWYMYYIPIIMSPILMILAVQYIGKPFDYKQSMVWKLILIPGVVLSVLVLFNEKNHLTFVPLYNESGYRHGMLYFLIIATALGCLGGVLVIVFHGAASKVSASRICVISLVVAFGIGYFILLAARGITGKNILNTLFEMPDFFCIFIISFWESLVYARLIPSNSDYGDFFKYSSVRAGIADNDGNIIVKSQKAVAPKKSQIDEALDGMIEIDDGKVALRSKKIKGGYFYWTENIRDLTEIDRKLSETADYLEEEIVMAEANNKLEESNKRIEEQTRLYEEIERIISPQLEKVSQIIENVPEDEQEFRAKMKYASVMNVYMKRLSNLLLIAGSSKQTDSEELALSIAESMNYLALSSISTFCKIDAGIMLLSDDVIKAFMDYERIVECLYGRMNAIMCTMTQNDNSVTICIEVGVREDEISEKELQTEFDNLDISLQDDCVSTLLSCRKEAAC